MNLEAKAESSVDLIICWPDNCDYPLWREFLNVHRDFFAKVIVIFTKTNQGDDYREFVRGALAEDKVTFLESRAITADEDWRNVAVNQALDASDGMWVWFTEQDFFVTSQAFWALIARYMIEKDAIGYKDGNTRLHPSCLFVKRSSINLTNRFFGIVPGRLDHFAKFYTSLRLSGAKIAELPRVVGNNVELWYHMNGLSHNMALLKRGEPVTYKPDEFLGYLQLCLDKPNLDPRFKELAEAGVKTLEAQLS